jgi:hypothetical protein
MKYLFLWIISFVISTLLMIILMKLLTNTTYVNIGGEDILILAYLSFSTIMASIVTSTKYLSDLIKKLKLD